MHFPVIGRIYKQEPQPGQILANPCMAIVLSDPCAERLNDVPDHQMTPEGISAVAMMLITFAIASAKKR